MIAITSFWNSFRRIEKAILVSCFCALLFFAGGFWSRAKNAPVLQPVFQDASQLKTATKNFSVDNAPSILVHVAGEVARPGVLQIRSGLRVADAIQKAGGATKAGDVNALNLAEKLKDGQKIQVLKRGAAVLSNASNIAGKPSTPGVKAQGRVVNINSASALELQNLPGVGPVMAGRIIEFRAKERINSLDELDEVKGLGPKKLEKIRPYVAF